MTPGILGLLLPVADLREQALSCCSFVRRELRTFAEEQQLPDGWLTGLNITEDDLQRLERLPGVQQTETIMTLSVTRTDSGVEDELSLSTRGEDGINAPHLVRGEAPSEESGLWLDHNYAEKNGLTVGDQITVTVGSGSLTLDIRGLILQPDKMAYTALGLVAPEPERYGYGIVSDSTVTALAKGVEQGQRTVLIRGAQEQVREQGPEILGERYLSYHDRESNPAVATVYERVGQIQSLSYLFSALFLLVALLSIFTSIRRLTDIQRGEVATLKALGFSNTTIGGYYTAAGGMAVVAGCVVGLAFTPLLSRYVLGTQQGSFSLPRWVPAYSPASGILLIILIAICVLASWTATRAMRRATPAEGLRPSVGRAKRTPLERLAAFWQRLALGSRWAIRDGTSNPVRVGMGVIAATGCMMLLIAGFGMPDTLNEQVRLAFTEQYRYDTRVGVSPLAQQQQREELERKAGPGQWIEQTPARIGANESEQTVTVLAPGVLFRPLDAGGHAMAMPETGAVITQRLAKQLGVSTGDEVTFSVEGEPPRHVHIAGVSAISEPQGLLISEEAWLRSGGKFVPNGYLAERPIDPAAAELRQVTTTFTRAEQRSNAQMLVDSLTSVFTLIKVFAIILAVIVLYNLGALSFTERVRDYATLRVLGLHHGEIRSLASRENAATTLVGWLAGIPAGWWFLSQYVGLFSTDRADYAPMLSVGSLLAASFITVFFAMTATLLLTTRIKGIDMTSALKGVE